MTTTHKIVSDTSLELKFVTSEFQNREQVYSELVFWNNLKWGICIGNTVPGHLGIYMDCYGNSSNLWTVTGKLTCKLLKNDKTYLAKHDNVVGFSCDIFNRGCSQFVTTSELLENYVQDGKITVKCCIEIQSITGFHKIEKHNFEEKDEDLSDVVLIVEDKKLHVSKTTLAISSPVFRSMFYSDFKESKAAEIPILDLKHEEFEQLLQLIYNYHIDINKSNAASLLRLADRFNVRSIAQKCEHFLIKSKTVSIADKLKIADEFNLSELHSLCLDSITNMADLKKFVPNINETGGETSKALYKKLMSFVNTN